MKTFVFVAVLVASALSSPIEDIGRIVGGKNAKRGDYPFIVSLQYKLPIAPEQHICGGSILSNEWILTAAHCLTELPMPGTIHIIAGMTDRENSEGEQWQKIKVVKRIVHEDYEGGATPNDIALLKLEKPIKYNDFVQPIAMPPKGSKSIGVSELAGWGSIHPNPFEPIVPTKLQMAEFPIIEYKSCEAAFEKFEEEFPLVPTNICTGPLTGGLSPCVGDSGGPLIQRTKSGAVQRGVVSWGLVPCGTVGAPAVYTDVASYIDWISKTLKTY